MRRSSHHHHHHKKRFTKRHTNNRTPYRKRQSNPKDFEGSSLSNLVSESLGRSSRDIRKVQQSTSVANDPIPSYQPQAKIQRGLSVLIPVYNEIRTIQKLVERVENCGFNIPIEIIVTDDCSTDGTDKILEELAATNRIRYQKHPKNRGKGAALKTCIDQINYDFALIQDADLEYDPKDYEKMLKPLLEDKADVVYGSRFIGGNERRILTFWHSMANKVLTLFSNMLTDMHLTDMETCYKCFKSDLLKDLNLTSNRFGVEPEITAKIKKMCAVVYEVPISYHGRNMIQGKKIGWKDGVAALYHILYFHFSSKISREEDFDRYYGIMQRKRFNQYLYQKIEPYLGQRIMEMGTGLGGLAQFLCNREKLLLTDKNSCYVRFLQRKFRGIPGVEAFQFNLEEDALTDQKLEAIDTILMMNVLEHLQEDEPPLKEAFDTLPEGGRIVLMVSLQRSLMCSLDKNLGRLGRYDAWEIREMLERAGFDVESFQQVSRLGALIWFFAGKVFFKKEFSHFSMVLYSLLTPLIKLWDFLLPWPKGLQGILVGVKPKKEPLG